MYSVILHCPSLKRDISTLLKILPESQIYEGLRMTDGLEASKLAHHAIVQWAKAHKEPCVWVLEDDCLFTMDFSIVRWLDDADWAQRHGYDIMVGGSTKTYDEKQVREGMIEVSAFHSSHCVVYFESGYDKVLKSAAPIDWTPGRDNGARCVVVWPFVAVQAPSFSGCTGRYENYVPLYQQHQRHLGLLSLLWKASV